MGVRVGNGGYGVGVRVKLGVGVAWTFTYSIHATPDARGEGVICGRWLGLGMGLGGWG